jgi:hypothetical protein
MGMA